MKYIKRFNNTNWDNELYSLLEKKIAMGTNLKDKLKSLSGNDTLAKKMLTFLDSDEIADKANISEIDYDKSDDKLLTIKDEKGNTRKFKFGKLLKYLGFDVSKIKPYVVENFIMNFKKTTTDNLKLVDGKDILKA